MKNKLPIIIALAAIIGFAIWYGFTDKGHRSYDNNVNTAKYEEIGVLENGMTVSQTITCEENQIDAISIKCNPAGAYEETVVNVVVKDAETGEELSAGSDVGKNVQKRKMHKFNISPIKGYKGKQLIIEVSETNNSEGNGITLYYQPTKDHIGSYLEEGEAKEGVLVMKTITTRFDVETCIVLFACIMFIWIFMWFLYRLFK